MRATLKAIWCSPWGEAFGFGLAFIVVLIGIIAAISVAGATPACC